MTGNGSTVKTPVDAKRNDDVKAEPIWPTSYYENPRNRTGPLRHDIETYSPVDLTECGVYVYSSHPDFDIILCAFAYGDGPVEVLDLAGGQPFPPWLEADLKNPAVTKIAYNAMFERTCWSAYFHTAIPPTGWVCTMIQAASVSYPFSLEKCGEALGTDVQKDKRGKDLIRLFSIPNRRRKKQPDGTFLEEYYRVMPQDAPEDWEVFKEYNRVDVETERSIAEMLKEYPLEGHELELYHLDQRINDRGILVDRVLVEEAIHCDDVFSQELRDKAIKLMGISNPNSPLQFRAWLESRGCMVDSLGKKQVAEVMEKLEAGEGDPVVREALRIRQMISKSSIKKYEAADRFMCDDDRFRGGFQFYGANHTGRWSGRGLQLQNLARNSLDTLDIARSFLREGNLEALELIYGNVPDVLSQLVRTMFIPKPGCRFIVADFSAIEARVLAWVAGEQWRLEAFRNGEDIYCASASAMFGVPVVKHGINGELRQKGKIAELACIAEGQLVLTDRGLIPIENVTTDMKVWDGEEWVNHDGVVYRGEREVITYDGLTATPDHLVLSSTGSYYPFSEFAGEQAVSEGLRKVYDIANAGRHHRFTVSGKLVHNCGYGGSVGALTSMGALEMGLKEEELPDLIKDWRKSNPKITQFWWDVDKAAMKAFETSTEQWVANICIGYFDNKLQIKLPSGRILYYVNPGKIMNNFGQINLAYDGVGQNKKWTRIPTYGPKTVENLVQGICRDILADAMLRVEAVGFDIVAHVHDEIICEVPIGVSSVEEICSIMSQTPDWADDTLPLNADGYECEYYKKD